MFACREDVGKIVFGVGVFLEVWIGAEDGGTAGDDGAACVEADGDEREEEADVEGYTAAYVSFVDACDYGVDEGRVGDNKGARERGLSG